MDVQTTGVASGPRTNLHDMHEPLWRSTSARLFLGAKLENRGKHEFMEELWSR